MDGLKVSGKLFGKHFYNYVLIWQGLPLEQRHLNPVLQVGHVVGVPA